MYWMLSVSHGTSSTSGGRKLDEERLGWVYIWGTYASMSPLRSSMKHDRRSELQESIQRAM